MIENPFDILKKNIQSAGFEFKDGKVEPDLAAVLSTVQINRRPSSRTLYIKFIRDNSLFFFTNENSRKGSDIKSNPFVSLCMFFEKSFKQIIIEGTALKANHDLAKSYFDTRSALSRAGAILSSQSSPLTDYDAFIKNVYELAGKEDLKCPDFWNCYQIIPDRFEFWSGNENRLHFRELFEKKENTWQKTILYP